MKPYDASSSNKSESNRKYGVTDLTIIENESEEAILRSIVALVDVMRVTSLRRAPELGDISLEYCLEG